MPEAFPMEYDLAKEGRRGRKGGRLKNTMRKAPAKTVGELETRDAELEAAMREDETALDAKGREEKKRENPKNDAAEAGREAAVGSAQTDQWVTIQSRRRTNAIQKRKKPAKMSKGYTTKVAIVDGPKAGIYKGDPSARTNKKNHIIRAETEPRGARGIRRRS